MNVDLFFYLVVLMFLCSLRLYWVFFQQTNECLLNDDTLEPPPIFQNISTKTKWKSQNKHRQQQWWWLQYVDQAGLGRQHSSRQFNLRTNCKTKPNPLRPQPPITQIFLDGYDCSRCFLGVMTTRDSFQLKSPPPSTQKSKHCYLAKKK